MFRDRKVKILATLGPASSSREMIKALYVAGVDVFRLNMSHGSHNDVDARYRHIRSVEEEIGRPIGVLADLQGPKLRLGTFADGPVTLKTGERFRVDLDPAPGDARRAPLPHREVFQALEPGSRLLINDGKVRLRVDDCGKDHAETIVEAGGEISDRKGVNVPDVVLPVAAITEKDRRDLDFALDLGADWIALSFVQRPEDVAEAKKIIAGRAAVMAKIEKPAAVRRYDEILELVDGIMVARGDLGVEMPIESVPVVQKQLISGARRAGKPVVVATHMLESMIGAPVPTRAEASDVAGAVFDGADAVMLSAESAAGAFPVEAATMMATVAAGVEASEMFRSVVQSLKTPPQPTSADAITSAAEMVAGTIAAAAIVCYTKSGSTGLRMSRERPSQTIVGLTPLPTTARRLTMAWGVQPVMTEDAENFREMVMKATSIVEQSGFAKKGDRIVITAGVPFGHPGTTNILRIAYVGTHRGVEPLS